MVSFKLIIGVFIIVVLVIREIAKDARKKNTKQQPKSQKMSTNVPFQQPWWSDVTTDVNMEQNSSTNDFLREKKQPALPKNKRKVTHNEAKKHHTDAIPKDNRTEDDIERWRRAVIDSEILKTKF